MAKEVTNEELKKVLDGIKGDFQSLNADLEQLLQDYHEPQYVLQNSVMQIQNKIGTLENQISIIQNAFEIFSAFLENKGVISLEEITKFRQEYYKQKQGGK